MEHVFTALTCGVSVTPGDFGACSTALAVFRLPRARLDKFRTVLPQLQATRAAQRSRNGRGRPPWVSQSGSRLEERSVGFRRYGPSVLNSQRGLARVRSGFG